MTGTSKVFVCTGDGTIRTFKEEAGGSVPVKDKDFTYSGNCEVIDDSNEVSGVQWRIKFKTSGELKFNNKQLVDVFLVGGGGVGSPGMVRVSQSQSWKRSPYVGGGGGGGYTKTVKSIEIAENKSYTIIIGSSTGTSSIQSITNCTASGGGTGTTNYIGGNGGSGGAGGYYSPYGTGNNTIVNGSPGINGNDGTASTVNGSTGQSKGGTGQGSTTREFGDPSGTLYSNGGSVGTNTNGAANTGNGGGGNDAKSETSTPGGNGGSGIVIIRKHKK